MPDSEIPVDPAEIAARFVNFTDRHIFLTGKAGTGKTTFLRKIVTLTHKKTIIAAPTGIAAINASGVTLHSLFQLPFGMFLPKQPQNGLSDNLQYHTPRTLTRHFKMNAAKRRIILDMELLIIDEVSMLRADMLDAIDLSLRYIRRNMESFGGVQLLLIGDLHQLPPVVKNSEWQVLAEFYKSIYFFDALTLQQSPPVYIELDKVYRQSDDTFLNLLNNLRNNAVHPADIALLEKYYKPDFKPAISDKYITLTTHNHKADTMNQQLLDELTTPLFLYKAIVSNDFPEQMYPTEESLQLKVGAQVMFTKNDPTGEQRFFNGKLAEVVRLQKNLIEVAFDEVRILVTPYTWENIRYTTDKVTNEVQEELIGTFEQYPLKLAWAITIHKSQGLTFDKAIIDIGSAFAPGQVYVALSRLRSLDGLVLTSYIQPNGIRMDQNIVYFTKNKPSAAVLHDRVKADSDLFLRRYLLQSFDFTNLDREIYEHSISFNKTEKRLAAQKHQDWAIQLQKELTALKKHSDGFMGQLNTLFSAGDSTMILARVAAAANYFKPLLEHFSDTVFDHIEAVKKEKYTAAYLNELIALEVLFYEQYKKILKAEAFLNASMHHKEFLKSDVQNLLASPTRTECIRMAYMKPEGKKGAANRPSKNTGDKKVKIPAEDTRETTLKLFESGKSIVEIAALRNMATGTIEGHLAYFVAKKELNPTLILSKRQLSEISKAVSDLKTISLANLKKHLGKGYSFGEIKIGLAVHLSQGE